jgi:REP element-mobilizing transposase RayT
MPPQYRKPMRLAGYDYANTDRACFITFHAKIKQLAPDSQLSYTAPFTHDPFAQQVVGALHHYERNNGLILFAYSLMPNHLHVLAAASPQTGDLIKLFFRFKSYTTRCAWAHGLIGNLWQRDCYDVIERKTNTSAQRIVAYILNNPIKAGLVARWEEHPYTRLIQHA